MNDSALQWLTERTWLPGTLACAFRQPDGNSICRSLDEICPTEIVERILGHYDTLAAAAFSSDPPPSWSNWAFEQGQIRFVNRPDGWRLAVVVRSDSEAAPALDSLSLEFLAMQLDSVNG